MKQRWRRSRQNRNHPSPTPLYETGATSPSNLELTDEETAALLRELDGLINGDRYFMSQRIKTLRAIRAKIWPEPMREPLPPPPKPYAPPRATAKQRQRAGR